MGNWVPWPSSTSKVDPEAAHIVFNRSGRSPWLASTSRTKRCARPPRKKRIEEVGTPLATFVSGLMDFFRKTYQDNQDFVDPPVHDPPYRGRLPHRPTCVETRRCPLDVEIHSELTLGMTVADLRGPEPSAEECHASGSKLDFDKF